MTKIGERFLREVRVFRSYPHAMRVLFMTNQIYSLAMPVFYLFTNTYILRKSDSVSMVLVYQLATYTSIPFTFCVNGWLLRHIQICRLYAAGMMCGGLSITVMMTLPALDLSGICAAGLIMGVSFGLYWSNRDFLALGATTDANRNYYYGLEAFFGSLIGLVVPLTAGWFLEWTGHWFGTVNVGYRLLTVGVFVLSVLASLMVCSGKFENPPPSRFLYFRFHWLWQRCLWLAVLKGLAQGYIMTVPAMLVTRFLGKEGVLGTAQSVGVLFSAGLLYFIGRKAKPEQRVLVYALGLVAYALGGVANAALFNDVGVIIFMLCLLLASPLLDFGYSTLVLQVIDRVAPIEGRNQFSYFISLEFGLYAGRSVGCGLFLVLAYTLSDVVALRYALMIIGFVQLLSVMAARSITRGNLLFQQGRLESCQTPSDGLVVSTEIMKGTPTI